MDTHLHYRINRITIDFHNFIVNPRNVEENGNNDNRLNENNINHNGQNDNHDAAAQNKMIICLMYKI